MNFFYKKIIKHKLQIISLFVFSLILVLVYFRWFIQPQIIGGDWPFFYPQMLQETGYIPPAWNAIFGNGLGGASLVYPLQSFLNFTILLSTVFQIPWEIVYKIVWFGLFIFLSIISPIFLLTALQRRVTLKQKLLASLIYSTNTYILMVVGGGQLGVGLAYAVSPLVLGCFIKTIDSVKNNEKRLHNALVTGLTLSLQIFFDARISYVVLIAVALYCGIALRRKIDYVFFLVLFTCVLPFLIVVGLHASWLFPILFFHNNPIHALGSSYTGVESFRFFSFADFSHSFSLLHPNWPENVFGKISFLYPQFLFLPIVAYSFLLAFDRKKDKTLLFFSLVGIIGTFLAKGTNLPFGMVNEWFFQHIPGFILFRDPTKFYVLNALAYMVLIPYSLSLISESFSQSKQKSIKITYLLFALFICYWMYLIFPAVSGKLGITFMPKSVPNEYVSLAEYIGEKPEFFRTLWVPKQQRFSYVSDNHPAIEAAPLFGATTSAELLMRLKNDKNKTYFQNLGIKYIFVPYDPYGEIFIKERTYDEKQYQDVVMTLRKISWIREIKGFGKIIIFQVNDVKNHFWITGEGIVTSKMLQPDTYTVDIVTKKPTTLIFVENYNPHWVAKIDGKEIFAKKTSDGFNSFFINHKGEKQIQIFFKQKEIVTIGWIVSFITIVMVLLTLIRIQKTT